MTPAPRTSTSHSPSGIASRERIDGYLPIGAYGLIGDCRSAALVGVDGSMDWLCLPRFDDPAVFGRILDAGKGGSWQLHPDEPHEVHQRYRDRTNLLDTVFATGTGVVVVTDFMPVDEHSVVQHAKPHAFPRVVRLVWDASPGLTLAMFVATVLAGVGVTALIVAASYGQDAQDALVYTARGEE